MRVTHGNKQILTYAWTCARTHTHTPSSFDTLGSFPNLWSSKVLSLPTNNSLLPLWSVFKLVMRISALFSESDYLNLFDGRVASYTPTDDVQRSFRESVGRLNDTPGLSNIYPGKRERDPQQVDSPRSPKGVDSTNQLVCITNSLQVFIKLIVWAVKSDWLSLCSKLLLS